ncbi:hypothetical protein VL15_16175 [Burkholderia cepacia]|uniref:Uncharacterized protein n=1 Tax=Burkholderia cepacia TaxID=292 RepID=A0A0J5X0Q3_BURCE|nr:hypothetical protein VL15_16175 [Burkholderia cepacia]
MQTSAQDRDEWRYYPEGLAPRSAGHVVRMHFMRIDFCDEFALRSLSDAHDQVDTRCRRMGK